MILIDDDPHGDTTKYTNGGETLNKKPPSLHTSPYPLDLVLIVMVRAFERNYHRVESGDGFTPFSWCPDVRTSPLWREAKMNPAL